MESEKIYVVTITEGTDEEKRRDSYLMHHLFEDLTQDVKFLSEGYETFVLKTKPNFAKMLKKELDNFLIRTKWIDLISGDEAL